MNERPKRCQGEADDPLQPERPDSERDTELAALAKAMAHPARVRILRLLAGQETCSCGEIVGELDLAQSTVSQHLKILKASGLVQGEVDGPRVGYCLDRRKLRRVEALVAVLLGGADGAP